MKRKIYRDYIKRFIDVGVSLVGLLITSPILVITAITIKMDSKGDVLFRQRRLGRYGNEFIIYKFRSMCMDAEKKGSGQYSFKGDPRVTRIGKLIRAASIDELPQFINIIKGDMSLIGPGMTGWAQVHGRKEVQWADRIEMGIWYAEHVSFLLDLKILILTVIKVLTNANNENTVLTTGNGTIEKK